MTKKLIAMAVIFAATVPLMADTQSDWYASLSSKREATEVRVNNEYWHASDADKPLPYRFSCGAVLRATAGSLRLDLNNTIITNGIYANGDFAILLSGSNYVNGGVTIGYGYSAALLIFGPGALTLSGPCITLVDSSELAICAGASVTVHDTDGVYTPTSGRRLMVNGSSLSIFAPDRSATQFDNINIIGSVVTICAKNQGLWAHGGNVVIDGSVVNVLSQNDRAIYTKTLVCQHSYLSCVSCSHYGISTTESHFDNSLVKVYGRSGAAINTDKVVFGEGDYYIVCGHPPMPTWSADLTRAVWANDIVIDGGNVQTCSVGTHDDSCAVDADHFEIDAGRLEIVDKVDVRDFLKYDAAAATAFTGALASGIDVTSLMANFYSQVILDAISNGKIGDVEGVSDIGMRCGTYTQDCGTVWCDLAKYGTVMSYRPVINGGSCKGWFKYYWSDDSVSPLNSAGNTLKCVSHAVAGAKKYDKITQSWSGVLPSYYGTKSLYADAAGKLYFWVPESWNVPGGGSGGGGGDAPIPTTYWTVTFNANGGSVSEATRQVANGTAIGGLPTPAQDGYVFVGWFTAATGGTMISETAKVVADVTYYAHWTINSGGSGGGAVDLAFYVPKHQGWTAPLIVSSDPFATVPQNVFEPGEPICLNYAFNNAGDGTAVGDFVNRFTLSNGYYLDDSWVGYSVSENGWGWIGYNFAPAFLNGLPPGDYTLTCTLNVTGALPESNTANNTASVSFKVKGPDLVVSSLSVSRETITVSESVVVNWRVANAGSAGAGKTKTSFLTYDYNSSTEDLALRKTELLDCDPLAVGGSREYTKTITGKALGVGEHCIAVWTDSKSDVAESSEEDNWKFVYVQVVNDDATSSKSSVDWQFYKMKGEADSFFLSSSPDMKKKTTTFNVGQPIYMRCCWWNAKKGAVSGNAMRVRVVMNGAPGVYADRSYFEKNYYYYFTDKTPDFLQDLPAGNYTLTAVLDSENAWLETNEKNNVKTISFTVVGRPTIYAESSYRCAVNVPVSWPVTIDGKATVKGLPSGLKYSGGAITGKATKAGTYIATFSASNAAGSTSKTITIVVANPGFAIECLAQPNGAEELNVVSGGTLDLFVGVKQSISLSATPGMAGVANSAASSMSAKGLPPGLKLANGVIAGVPTKPGSYSTSVTVKNKYGWTSNFTLNFKVSALPAWAFGTFEGGGGTTWTDGARVTLAVTSAGKLSGKVFRLGETWTMSAPSYSACVDGVFVLDATLKSGKVTITAPLYVWCFAGDSLGACQLDVDVWDADIYAVRLAWGSTECAETLSRAGLIGTTKTLEGEAWNLGTGESIKLTFSKNGAVKATAQFAEESAGGKMSLKKATAAASLAPWQTNTLESGQVVLVGARIFLYFPASSKKAAGGRFLVIDVDLVNGDMNLPEDL